jgi:glutaconate CoA-transferase subunit B
MELASLHPGVDLERVRENLGWEPKVSAAVGVTEAPRPEELRLIREELDPGHLYV